MTNFCRMPLIENQEYYLENGKVIFTDSFHLKRGSCCGNNCRHCPYEKPPVKGNTKLENMPKNHIQVDLKKALYLDDQRTPTTTIPGYHPWDVVRNYAEFTDYIQHNGIPDLISFDHDLADEHIEDYYKQKLSQGFQDPDYNSYQEKTGLSCAMWLVEYSQQTGRPIKAVSVHSHNPVGAKNIQDCINSWKKYCNQTQDCYIGKHPFTIENK